MNILNDESYMRLALQMAGQAQGQTGINPVVGCVIVKDGRIVGLGSHLRMGSAHAEIHALQMAGSEAEGSTVYVTLEPCSHYGQTPPCCDRLIAEKVRKVVVAAEDPNPLVAGNGIRQLREQGIEVQIGLLQQEARDLNEVFNKYIQTKLPFVSLKTASTLDGKIAAASGDSKWITNEQSREFVHTLRHKHQAIMIGVNTAIADNPLLNTRLSVPSLDSLRLIVDSNLRIPEDSRLVSETHSTTLVLTTERASIDKRHWLESRGIEVLTCGDGTQVDLNLAMKLLGDRGIGSILLEGGGVLNGSMLSGKLVDKMYLFFAPILIGGQTAPASFVFPGIPQMKDAIRLERLKVEHFGDNVCFIGYPTFTGGDE
ncbi:MAG TPA: bifunctional diaminohydroxyphosphoribosylaminopyrimidine deaminase/5-amino-6-(5-phosphoribosylamino)uracil reductase RibD [Bacilli bacterium]